MTHDEMIAVIEHHKNGGKIEFIKRNGTWTQLSGSEPTWNFQMEAYRIKSEPRSLWRVEHKNGNSAGTFDNRHEAKVYCSSISGATIHEYKEVLP